MKKIISLLLALLLVFGLLSGCAGNSPESGKNGKDAKPNAGSDAGQAGEENASGAQSGEAETVIFTDSVGREVELPANITRIAPSGSVATMILAAIAPEYLVCVGSVPEESQRGYLADNLFAVPVTGQLYGGKSTLNLEELLSCDPQVIIDLGDVKGDVKGDMDALQEQTGIPCVFIEADLAHMAQAFRMLGGLLDEKAERAEELAAFLDRTLAMAEENSAKIPESERISVMFTSGSAGLGTDAAGSVQAQVLDIVGAENAIVLDDVSNKGGGNEINMEQLYLFDPDVILFAPNSIYDSVGSDVQWGELEAVRAGRYYEVPSLPYNWMANPPSMNMVLGIWWLGNLLYPEVYDYDMAEVTQEIFELFWNCTLTEAQLSSLLENSGLKQ